MAVKLWTQVGLGSFRISNDKNQTAEKAKETEVKDDTFSIFILKAQATSLAQAETFLKNRKWTVASSTNLKEALAYIIKKQPQYVLITADHPNKKVKILPKMLAQAFPVKIIGFAEKSGSDSGRSLVSMGLEYNLYPPVSGPAIERIVLKIRKDDETKAKDQDPTKASLSGKSEGGGDQAIRIGGGAPTGEDDQKRSFEQARAALAQMMNDGNDGELAAKSDVHIQKGGAQNQYNETQGSAGNSQNFQDWEDAQKKKRGAGFNQQDPGNESGTGYNPHQQARDANGNPMGSQAPGHAGYGNASQGGPGSGHGPHGSRAPQPGLQGQHGSNGSQGLHQGSHSPQAGQAGSSTGLSPDDLNLTPEEIAKARAAREAAGLSEGSAEGAESPYNPKGPKRTPIMEAEYQRRKEKELRYFSEAANSPDNDSIIVKGTHDALNSTVNINGGENPNQVEEIEQASNVACITIESPRFSGYLICALAKDQKVDKSLIDMINKRLMSFLKENGESVKDQDAMEIKIQAVDFIDWSIEQAQFLKKSTHNGQEIAMAFFPHKDMKTVFEATGPNNMIQLSLDELKADTPVEFDLYIYMPENNKYILYTPEGGNLYGRQKNRLKEKGVSHMHVKESAVAGLKKYQAQNYLNDQIDVYKANKKEKKDGDAA